MHQKTRDLGVVAVLLIAALASVALLKDVIPGPIGPGPVNSAAPTIKQFASSDDFQAFIAAQQSNNNALYYGGSFGSGGIQRATLDVAQNAAVESGAPAPTAPASGGKSTDGYSATNNQVAGVDEADIIKTDGTYIYGIAQNNLYIVQASPGSSARLLTNLTLNGTPTELFINGDRLIVFGYHYEAYPWPEPSPLPMPVDIGGGIGGSDSASSASPMTVEPSEPNAVPVASPPSDTPAAIAKVGIIAPDYFPRYTNRMFLTVFDITDRSNPRVVSDVRLDGDYYDSRMVGDYVYFIVNQPVQYNGGGIPLPLVTMGGMSRPAFGYTDIYYFDYPDYSYHFTDVASINLKATTPEVKHHPFLLGSTYNLYVSEKNIYATSPKQFKQSDYMDAMFTEAVLPVLPADVKARVEQVRALDISDEAKYVEMQSIIMVHINTLTPEQQLEFQKQVAERMEAIEVRFNLERQKTFVHRIRIADGVAKYEAQGEVPGMPLNQFSMDEESGYLRIATTTGGIWTLSGEIPSANHVYVLNSDMDMVGKLEDLAPGERIYSARFMGNRAYLVTFKQVDPLFVIDLSNPASPTLMGKLKIPGVSDYLHPYDATHIIGVGRNTEEDKEGDIARFQGLKLALFDVSDVNNPVEQAVYYIGDRGTDSEALRDHKAFLFDREKNLLVIPVLLAEIDESQIKDEQSRRWAYGTYTYQGAYVFGLTPETGFTFRGRITHVNDTSLEKSGAYYYDYGAGIMRSLYIGNELFTLSSRTLKINDLSDLHEVKTITLPYDDPQYKYGYGLEVVRPMGGDIA